MENVGNTKSEEEDIMTDIEAEKEGLKGEINDEVLPIDSLDSGRSSKKHTTKMKKGPDEPTSKSKEPQHKKGKSLKEKLLDSLDENGIKELLLAKKELDDKNQILEEKGKLLIEYEDLIKRKQADFDNYRKRIMREIEENKKYATVEIVLDILNIIDNFERAIDSAKSSRDFDALLEGIVIIENEFKSLLEKKYGVNIIDAVGKEFDPTIHDAIMMEESDEYPEDTVVEDFQKGYKMHDRIIRHSKVKVAKAVSSTNNTDNNEKDNSEGELPEKGE